MARPCPFKDAGCPHESTSPMDQAAHRLAALADHCDHVYAVVQALVAATGHTIPALLAGAASIAQLPTPDAGGSTTRAAGKAAASSKLVVTGAPPPPRPPTTSILSALLGDEQESLPIDFGSGLGSLAAGKKSAPAVTATTSTYASVPTVMSSGNWGRSPERADADPPAETTPHRTPTTKMDTQATVPDNEDVPTQPATDVPRPSILAFGADEQATVADADMDPDEVDAPPGGAAAIAPPPAVEQDEEQDDYPMARASPLPPADAVPSQDPLEQLVERAHELTAANKWVEALNMLDDVIPKIPLDNYNLLSRAYNRRAMAHARLARDFRNTSQHMYHVNSCFADAYRVLDADPSNSRALHVIITMSFEARQIAQIEDGLRRMRAVDPNNPALPFFTERYERIKAAKTKRKTSPEGASVAGAPAGRPPLSVRSASPAAGVAGTSLPAAAVSPMVPAAATGAALPPVPRRGYIAMDLGTPTTRSLLPPSATTTPQAASQPDATTPPPADAAIPLLPSQSTPPITATSAAKRRRVMTSRIDSEDVSQMVADAQEAEEATLRSKYSSWNRNQLAELLRLNGQSTTGVKSELIERVVFGEMRGALPMCPKCLIGHLRYENGMFVCPGGFDHVTKGRVKCTFKADHVQLKPWKMH